MTLLEQELNTVGNRFRLREWWRSFSVICIMLAITGLACLLMQVTAQWMHPNTGWYLIGASAIGLLFSAFSCFRQFRDPYWLAERIEEHYPELDQRLVTTLDEVRRNDGKPLSYLQHTVFQETVAHSYHNPWWKIIPERTMTAFRSRGLAAFCLMLAIAIGLMKWQPPASAFVSNFATAAQETPSSQADYEIKVEPGNDEVEKGSSLIVVARFGKSVPKEATIVATPASNSKSRQSPQAKTPASEASNESLSNESLIVPMSRSLDDPLFFGTVSDIQQEFTYHVVYGGNKKSDEYRVTVFTYPDLVRADALLEYPSYTNLPDKRVEDTRRVSVVEGTRATWKMHLNKPGITAELVPEGGGDPIPLQTDATDPLNHLVSLDLMESATWKLHLTDADGRENRIKPTIKAKVTPNLAPKLKLEIARDARVSPIEEFLVKATVSDDYGLKSYGVSYTLADDSPRDVVLGENAERREKKAAEHQLDFEALDAEPDQLLSYYFWAEDTDAQGNARRTLSDMYFAEVRHFEEIFREGEQQAGQQQQQSQQQQQQQSQNAQDAQQLADLQKQIVNATWTMIRREIKGEPSDLFEDDLSTILESQQTASQQLQQLSQNVQDSQSQGYVMEVQKHMNNAIKTLTKAYSEKDVASLTPAMTSERAAYQALLKLRAREHEVRMQQQQQGQQSSQQSSSRQRMQQQLNQLQLKNEQNRYETERNAQQEENQEQTEMRQALSRLRELAQRQQDLNEQLKELQNALEQAETEEEKEEIERQLKRLRDQQEEMLRDTDELMERLDEAQNQEAMQETREQLEQTREQMRESAQQLQKGEVTPALTSGTRAQRELEEMRDELRKASANEFEDQMRNMRERVRDLENRQKEIGDELAQQEQTQQEGAGLRAEPTEDSEEKQKLGDALREQNQKLNDLLQEIEETVMEAQETEPLLADNLYEAFEQISENQTPARLDRAAELSDRGLTEPAQQFESEARESISQFREQIDRAAESVLGDETDALRTAVRMLEDLERQLDNEIDQFNPNQEPGEQRGNRDGQQRGDNAEGDEQFGEGRERSSEDTEEGSSQRGDRREGEQDEQQRGEGEERQQGDREQGDREERSEREREQNRSDRNRSEQQQEGNQQGQQEGNQRGEQRGEQQSNQRGQQENEQQSQQQQQGGGSGQGQNPEDQDQEQQDAQRREQQNNEQRQGEQQSNQQGSQGQGNQEGNPNGNQRSDQPRDGNNRQPRNLRDAIRQGDNRQQRQDGGGWGGWEQLEIAPITGEDFREWSDRLRDVEEIVDDPEMRAEAARIREQARSFRREFKRHSKEPKWDLIKELVARPLGELRQEVSEELLRRSAEKNALVPIDRDPVPEEFVEQVRQYYENLGRGE